MEVMTEGGRYLAWISHVGGRWEADLRSWCGDHLGTQATSSDLADGDWYLAYRWWFDGAASNIGVGEYRWAIFTRNREDHALVLLTWS